MLSKFKFAAAIICSMALSFTACDNSAESEISENPSKPAITDSEAVSSDAAVLAITFGASDSADSVTTSLTLPASGINGTTITWTSSDSSIIEKNGAVTRPAFGTGDTVITLTATVSRGDEATTVSFTLTVKEAAPTDAEAVSEDAEKTVIRYSEGDDSSSITSSIVLPESGANGTSITWTSSNSSVIAQDGTVIRPYTDGSDTEVTLSATVSKGDESTSSAFTVTVKGLHWSSAEVLFDNGYNAYRPEVAFDGTGNAICVWHLNNESSYGSIYAKRYNASEGAWESDDTLLETSDENATYPKIALDNEGNAICVWRQHEGLNIYSIYAARYSSSEGTWSTAELLENTDESTDYPTIKFDRNGNAICTWRGGDYASLKIYANIFNASDKSWKGAEVLDSDNYVYDNLQISLDSNGDAVCYWITMDPDSTEGHFFMNVYSQKYNSSEQAWDKKTLLFTGAENAYISPLGIYKNGNILCPYIVYSEDYSSVNYYVSLYSRIDDTWTEPSLVENNFGEGRNFGYQLALDADEKIICMWEQYNAVNGYDIYVSRYNLTIGALDGRTRVGPSNGPSDPKFAFDNNGNAFCVWQYNPGSGTRIYISRLNNQ